MTESERLAEDLLRIERLDARDSKIANLQDRKDVFRQNIWDSLGDQRRFRTFDVLDDYNREGLGIEVDFSLPSGTYHSFTGADHRVARETTGVALRQGPRAHQSESDHWAT